MLQPCQLGRNRSRGGTDLWFLGDQPEQLSDEPNLGSNIIAAHTSNLAFPNHVHRLIALKRSPGRMEFPEALLGVDPAFDRTMILLEDVVQVLDRAMATAPTKNPFLLDGQDRRGVDGRQVRFPVEEGFLHNGVLAHLWW